MEVYVDNTLTHLCRLLRFLNISCTIIDSLTHEVASNKNALIITRNKKLYEECLKNNINAHYTTSTNKYEILKEVQHKIKISLNRNKICTICNTSLQQKSKHEIKSNDIPPKVLIHHEVFFYCQKCNKYYWKGKHWKNIQYMLHKYNIK